MNAKPAVSSKDMDVLSRIMFQGYRQDFCAPVADLRPLAKDFAYVAALNEDGRAEFLRAANDHHVIVRVLQAVQHAMENARDTESLGWCLSELEKERARIAHAIGYLSGVCNALESAGCSTVVIKSLDHWPDLGSDLDLYTTGDPITIRRVLQTEFQAREETRSWGDRLAGKWNFSLPGLPELIEVHVRYLGQTGEHRDLGKRLMSRRSTRTLLGKTFSTTAPEDRIAISTLQRMYRHFYFRLCDMADTTSLLQQNKIEFAELRRTAELGGIWQGVATYLVLVAEYAKSYGADVELPMAVLSAAYSPDLRVYLGGNFLRVPKGPAISLYASQLLHATAARDLRAITRLPLLPPLALSALLAYRLTGSDKGVW
jgi:hypothetical protein